ncbi:hypothetical protein GGR88_002708 [Sphingomonas jejuensis]|uniref:Uncharacterized protein n=1 Tax=Sphingomonas jejuensis TaxID=904715 RepID=A0ABX0XPK5_9SPHN|nr:hypothetical protein [Sphingomonas jejuensis]NJC35194.1 hypothetical protein [Sphingomonas jejuensis]
MTTGATATIALAVAQRRNDVIDAHRRAGAVSPRRAIHYDPPTRIHKRYAHRLVRQGVLRQEEGRTWLDDHALSEHSHKERCIALKVLIGLMAVLGVILLSQLR